MRVVYDIKELEPSIVLVTWRNQGTAETWREYMAWHRERMQRALDRGERLALIHDARAINSRPDPETRHAMADFMEQGDERELEICQTFLVHDSMVLRGVMTALRWVSNRVDGVHAVKTVDEAVRRAREYVGASTGGVSRRA